MRKVQPAGSIAEKLKAAEKLREAKILGRIGADAMRAAHPKAGAVPVVGSRPAPVVAAPTVKTARAVQRTTNGTGHR